MKKPHLIFGLAIAFVIFVSGCLDMSPESMALTNPLVKQFMQQYPNAKITVNHFTASQSAQIIENISAECGNPYIEAKEFYRVAIDDPDSGLKVIAWIDWENKSIECAIKYGGGADRTISKPGEETKTCKSHAEAKCYGEHVYWFDSCGHVQEKKEYCTNGCENGFCKEKAGSNENCEPHAQAKCYEGHVYWYDSCGSKEEKKEYCTNGCENGACVAAAGTGCGDGTCETVEKTLTQGEEYNFTLYGKGHSVKFIELAPYAHTATIKFDGMSKEIEKGNLYKISTVPLKFTGYSDEGQNAQITLVIGESKDSCAVDCGGQSICTDSDNGKNYYVKGTAIQGTQMLSDQCTPDGLLSEKFCENNEIKEENITCPEGGICSDARCVIQQ